MATAQRGFTADNPDPYANETKEQRDERMEWWREAKFGLFIHWGVYAVPAGIHKGEKIPGYGEHIMRTAKIPIAEYRLYAKQFNPVKYDPDAWVRLAKDAGMKYVVITAKHHDGFALFDSKASDWDMVDATPYGEDLIAPLAEACQKQGLRFGVYYSHSEDWCQGGSFWGTPWDPSHSKETIDKYVDTIAVPQVKELLVNYKPDVIWWGTPGGITPPRAAKLLSLLKLRPGIIHNDRMGANFKGDIHTAEQVLPLKPPGGDWEACVTMNDTWGYKSYDNAWKPTSDLIWSLVDIASKGGNYLLNIGPKPDGTIPEASVARLKEVGQWTKAHGEAIYGSQQSPIGTPPWGRLTRKELGSDSVLYLHIRDWSAKGLFIPAKNDVKSCRLLTDKTGAFKVSKDDDGLTVELAGEAPDALCSVIRLHLSGEFVHSGALQLREQADGSFILEAEFAESKEEWKQTSYDANQRLLTHWYQEKGTQNWTFKVKKPTVFEATFDYIAHTDCALTVSLADQSHRIDLKMGTRHCEIGRFEIKEPGLYTLTLMPVPGHFKPPLPMYPVALRAVTLKPTTKLPVPVKRK